MHQTDLGMGATMKVRASVKKIVSTGALLGAGISSITSAYWLSRLLAYQRALDSVLEECIYHVGLVAGLNESCVALAVSDKIADKDAYEVSQVQHSCIVTGGKQGRPDFVRVDLHFQTGGSVGMVAATARGHMNGLTMLHNWLRRTEMVVVHGLSLTPGIVNGWGELAFRLPSYEYNANKLAQRAGLGFPIGLPDTPLNLMQAHPIRDNKGEGG